MNFTKVVKSVRTDGMKAAILRSLFNLKVVNEDEVGAWAERHGYKARLDGVTISLDNHLITTHFKGRIIVGWYEEYEREIIQKYLPQDEPVIELGGSIGVVACQVNRRLLSPEKHVVVEANPELIPTLKKNRDLNGCQFEIVEAAIGYGSEYITFFSNDVSLLGSIYHGGGQKWKVAAKTLQSIAENAGFRYFNVISDIEGSEIGLIDHEIDFIREHVGLLLIETHDDTPHGDEGVKFVVDRLETYGFEIVDSIRNNYCFRNRNSLRSDDKKDQQQGIKKSL
jgi:FkbM family methyltransferase